MLSTLSKKLCNDNMPKLSGYIYAIGRNYAAHAAELNNELPKEPLVFLMSPSSLREWEEGATAFQGETFHHEIELVLLVGEHSPCGSVPRLSSLTGITLGLDLTRREVQTQLKAKGHPWTTAKNFQGSAFVGTFHSLDSSIWETGITFSLDVNGETKQSGDSRLMLFPPKTILTHLLGYQDLYPGDLIFTGTPAGVGPVRHGDELVARSRELGIQLKGQV